MPRKTSKLDLLAMQEAAELLRRNRSTVHRMGARGELETVTRGCRRYVTRRSLDAYLGVNENPPPDAATAGEGQPTRTS